MLSRLRGRRGGRGSAVVDFVLVMVVLVPMVLAILQVALVLLVRNTLAAAASDGARYAATLGHQPGDGAARTRQQIAGAISGRYADQVSAGVERIAGTPTVVVTVHATVPALGIGGPAIELSVAGHAVQEQQS